MPKLDRKKVYALIDGERDYQDSKWNCSTTSTCGIHSPVEWLVYMEDYINEAKHIASRGSDNVIGDKVNDIIRKIGAMAVACMEQNGAPPRVPLKDAGLDFRPWVAKAYSPTGRVLTKQEVVKRDKKSGLKRFDMRKSKRIISSKLT